MIQVIEGKIKQYNLPKIGTLKDGSTVSGYHLLDDDILRDEGWLPLEDIPPEHDIETQYLANDGYEILEDKVIMKYRIEVIPESQEPELDELETLKGQVQDLQTTIDVLLGVDDIE